MVTTLKQGWLQKQGNYIKNWRPRYFLLVEGVLSYYKDPTMESQPTNQFLLTGCSFRPFDKISKSCIEMTLPTRERRYLQAKTEEEMYEWISVLNKAACPPAQSPETIGRYTPEDFVFHKVLGRGNYGKVLLASLKNRPFERFYAVKLIRKSALVDAGSIDHVLSENRVLQIMRHPFLITLFGSFQTCQHLYFVMEYIKGGELFHHLAKKNKFSKTITKFYCCEIVSAISYIHSCGVVYRDLKLENILLDWDGHIRIIDFGLCKDGLLGKQQRTNTFCGTPTYLSPEALQEENYGMSVDWWALGVVVYEMLVGRPPFGPSNNIERLFQNILSQPLYLPPNLSPDAADLLTRLLCRDHKSRLGCGESGSAEVKGHSFFQDINWNYVDLKMTVPPILPTSTRESITSDPKSGRESIEKILAGEASPIGIDSTLLYQNTDSLNIQNFTYVATNFIK